MAESFFILWGQDLDSWLTDHFSISPDDNRYPINKQASTQAGKKLEKNIAAAS
jgi:hypothetical protein